jgi:hypothetical protein
VACGDRKGNCITLMRLDCQGLGVECQSKETIQWELWCWRRTRDVWTPCAFKHERCVAARLWRYIIHTGATCFLRDEVSDVDYWDSDEHVEQAMRENEEIASRTPSETWKNLREMDMSCHRLTWSHCAEMFHLLSLGESQRDLLQALREQPEVL